MKATKLREQVAKQQLYVLRQLGREGISVVEDTELQCHQKLQNLYNSTRAAKHFQSDIARGVKGFILGSKKANGDRKLAENYYTYGAENNESDTCLLARVSLKFVTSARSIEEKREIMLKTLHEQVSEPLHDSRTRAPLEDARHLAHNYKKLRQEVESQATEIMKPQLKCRHISQESMIKLKNAEARLEEFKSLMAALGKEATDAMLSVEDEQQRETFQKLRTMVGVERSYHRNALSILEDLLTKMIPELEAQMSPLKSETLPKDVNEPYGHQDSITGSYGRHENQNGSYFVAKVIHPFDAQADGELSLLVDEFIVVHQVGSNGWSEGECMGNCGWFPSAYVEEQDEHPSTKPR